MNVNEEKTAEPNTPLITCQMLIEQGDLEGALAILDSLACTNLNIPDIIMVSWLKGQVSMHITNI